MALAIIRHDWDLAEIEKIYRQPFNDLLFQANSVHREYFDPNSIQLSSLLSIKTGACPEDCAYCPQSGHYETGIAKEKLWPVAEVVAAAQMAKQNGATRFCMGAAWKSPPQRDFPKLLEMVAQVKDLGLETCLTAGMLSAEQAASLQAAGLDYYNHNLDTSPEYYEKIISTRTYQDRLDTLQHVRDCGMKTCCGGIIGMGEDLQDRLKFLQQLANLPQHPTSVPINQLIPIPGTPLGEVKPLDPFDFVRIIAVSRILMPQSYVRISAGRNSMSDECQALCFFAGANSIFLGEKLLTTPLPESERDFELFARLDIRPEMVTESESHSS